MEKFLKTLTDKLVVIGFDLLWAIIVLFVGFRIIKILEKSLKKSKLFSHIDSSVKGFIINFLVIFLKVMVFVCAAAIIGIPMTSMITLIGSAAVAIGLALQGGLSNIAGGVMILMFRPFKVGDYIMVGSLDGTVNSITIFYTILIAPDQRKILLPNGSLISSNIINYSAMPVRRLDLSIGVGYDSDIKKVKKVLLDMVNKEERVIKDQPIFVEILEYEASDILIGIRVFVKQEDFLNVKCDFLEQIKVIFDKEKIEIPYQKIDINLKK